LLGVVELPQAAVARIVATRKARMASTAYAIASERFRKMWVESDYVSLRLVELVGAASLGRSL
jgi:hypothetical protein